MLKFNVRARTQPKMLINIGACLDIPTASIVIGNRGETIFNGGLGQVTGVVGPGNSFKSTLLHYMMLSAANKMAMSGSTAMTTYDTEVNISLDRLTDMAKKFESFDDGVIIGEDAPWTVTDKSISSADDWVDDITKYAEAKSKNKSLLTNFTAFNDPYTKKVMSVVTPTFGELDSLSEFESSRTELMLNTNIDDSKTNTTFMQQGLFKTKWMSKIPKLTISGNVYLLMTAHIGTKINMASGPAMYNQPTKKLQYLKPDDAIKGVSNKFFFLLSNGWYAHTASVLKNQTTKLPEYPKYGSDGSTTELNLVKLTQLRSKSGTSGYTISLVVSQTEGVLPSLTEFHNIKTNGKFGISGSDKHYFIDLLPDVSLSRTTVRKKLEENVKLRRAVNICSELQQLTVFHPELIAEGLMCTPAELYKDLKDKGYDWHEFLDTRGYWLPDQYGKNNKNYLGSIDLLKLRAGTYTPYWMEKK